MKEKYTSKLLNFPTLAVTLFSIAQVVHALPLNALAEDLAALTPANDHEVTIAHVISGCVFDVLIAIAYFAIPLQLYWFFRHIPHIPAKQVVVLFIAFISLCGMSHLVNSWIPWWPTHTLLLIIKCLTAAVSLITTSALYVIMPKALALPLYAASMELEVENRIESERSLIKQNKQLDKLRKVTARMRGTLHISNILETVSSDVLEHLDAKRCLIYSQRAKGDFGLVEDQSADTLLYIATESGSVSDEHSDTEKLLRTSRRTISDSSFNSQAPSQLSEHFSAHLSDLLMKNGGPLLFSPGDSLMKDTLGCDIVNNHQMIVGQFTDSVAVYFIVLLYPQYLGLDASVLEENLCLMLDICQQVTVALEQATMIENERKRAKQFSDVNVALMQARKEVENVHSQREFLAVMSHEMRTPLFATSALSSILLESPVLNRDAAECIEISEMLRVIQMSNDMLIGIVNNILDFTKYENEKFHLEEAPFSLRDAIETAIEIVCVSDDKSKFPTVNYFINGKVPEVVVGDFTRFRQIVVNLINNACKFTPPAGKVNVYLSVLENKAIASEESASQNVTIKLDIADNGIGIAEEAIERLYEKFFQADRSITRKFGGTGLGLAIVKRLTELMDGHIHVKSEPNKGTIFTVDMSFKGDVNAHPSVPNQLYHYPNASLGNLCVAYVDNNQANRDGFKHLMDTMGVSKVFYTETIFDLAKRCQSPNKPVDYEFQVIVVDMATVQRNGCFPLMCSLLEDISPKNLLITGNACHHRQWRRLNLPEGISVTCMVRPIKARPMENFLLSANMEDLSTIIKEFDLPSLTPVSGSLTTDSSDPIDTAFLQAMRTSVQKNTVIKKDLKLNVFDLPPMSFADLPKIDLDIVEPLSELPRVASAEDLLKIAAAVEEETRKMKLVSAREHASPMIMVAEDNPVNQMVIGKMLTKLKQNFIVVNNGQEAIDMFEQDDSIDIIFMDIMMPVKDGFQASHEIRKFFADNLTLKMPAATRNNSLGDPNFPQSNPVPSNVLESATVKALYDAPKSVEPTPTRPWIIALTANAFWDDRVKCLEAGMNDFVAKPAKLTDIEAALAKYAETIKKKPVRVNGQRLSPGRPTSSSVLSISTACN